jgi:putative oxidoreductase
MRLLRRLLDLPFVPRNVDAALLALRVWFGASLVALHGWGKLTSYTERMDRFADPFGIGSPASLALSVFAEVVCASLLCLGLFTRFAAAVCVINMTVAFVYAHGASFTGPRNGELAFMYLGAFVTLLLAGAGRFSLDGKGSRA